MQAWPDIWTTILAVGVIALFAGYFWFVGHRMLSSGRRIAEYLDNSSARKRAAIERENRFGKDPLWLRALRVLMIALLICACVALFWNKFRA